MAVHPLRPQRRPRGTHGIHPRRKPLLRRVLWSPPKPMISSKPATPPFLSVLCALCVLCAHSFFFLSSSPAQNLYKPVTNIDEEVTAFAYAPNGNVVFSVRRMFKTKKYDLQRDDIWLLESGGKRKRLLEGQKFTREDKLFTYQVESFTWSPNAHIIAVQLFTTTMDPDAGARQDAPALLLLDDSGRELRPSGKDPLILEARNPLWLRDNQTLTYL